MKKKSLLLGMLTVITVVMLSVFFVSCGGGDDDSNSGYSGSGNVGVSISGTWYNSAADETMILGKDGSYYSYLGKDKTGPNSQYRKGTYSYNSAQGLFVENIVEGGDMKPGGYQRTLIVQTLTSNTLVLLYLEGDVQGYYTRK